MNVALNYKTKFKFYKKISRLYKNMFKNKMIFFNRSIKLFKIQNLIKLVFKMKILFQIMILSSYNKI